MIFFGEFVFFDTEVLSVCPNSLNATVMIGLTQKGFRPGHEPGTVDKSVGFRPSTGRCVWPSCYFLSLDLDYVINFADFYYNTIFLQFFSA